MTRGVRRRLRQGLNRLAGFVERMEAYQDDAASSSSNATEATATFALSATPRDEGAASGGGAPAARGRAGGSSRIRNVQRAALPADAALDVSHLSLTTPDGSRTLFEDVTLAVRTGEHLLITGESGAGKSSMLRAVAGLWTRGSGDIARPPAAETMFLPQKPYCTLGSLRKQLAYPATADEFRANGGTDAELLAALEAVQLSRLAANGVAGLDDRRDWSDELSLGEQQRLAFARVLLVRHAAAAPSRDGGNSSAPLLILPSALRADTGEAAAGHPRRGDVRARPAQRGRAVRGARPHPRRHLPLRRPPPLAAAPPHDAAAPIRDWLAVVCDRAHW